jgi:molybdopterin-synthase adenylyltransferase
MSALPDLSDAQLDRYARHIIMPEIGGLGQRKLCAAKVLVIGAGGLGSPVLEYLAAAGVGTLGIVDDDVVEVSNLQRQTIHATPDIGKAKTHSAATRIAALNPDVHVVQHDFRLTEANADEMIAAYDIIADGSDSFTTRFAVGAACVRQRKILVSAAVGRLDGQLATFIGHLPDQPCYRCFVPQAPGEADRTCAEAGVIGALTGIMGTMQALEVIRLITGMGDSLAGKLLLFESLSSRQRIITLPKDPACPHCNRSH